MNHLTDDQIDDLLIGDAAADSVAHMESCSHCAVRLAAAQSPIASFNAASLAWGQRRSATLPLQLRQSPRGVLAGSRLRVAAAAVGTTAAAVFALALALPMLHHGSAAETAHQANPQAASAQTEAVAVADTLPAVAATQSQTSEDQIARDNRLLQAIDRELATSETPADLLKMSGHQDSNQSSPGAAHND
jgi:hypothetical protein